MAKTYEQIQRQIESLQAEAERLRRQEIDEVIGRIREAIEHYGITAADLGLQPGRAARKTVGRKKPGPKVAAKAASGTLYRDAEGRSWAGRGKRPQWLRDALTAGHSLDEFRVAPG